MSSLKYIFVIEGNALVRKVVNETSEEKAAEQYFPDTESVVPDPEQSSKEPEPRNKRNKTSGGK